MHTLDRHKPQTPNLCSIYLGLKAIPVWVRTSMPKYIRCSYIQPEWRVRVRKETLHPAYGLELRCMGQASWSLRVCPRRPTLDDAPWWILTQGAWREACIACSQQSTRRCLHLGASKLQGFMCPYSTYFGLQVVPLRYSKAAVSTFWVHP